PVGGGLWVLLHPEDRVASPATEWTFAGRITRMPEFTAPALGNRPNLVTIDATVPASGNGVLYSLGGFSAGLTCYVQDGILCYEYNLFEIARTQIKAKAKLPVGKVKIEVQTTYVGAPRPAGALSVTLKANGAVVAQGQVPVSAPVAFTANGCLNIGSNLGSPVSLDYFDLAPFTFNGTIDQVHVAYT
ncbi:MAG: hypothetical protein WA629_14225, partial [Candidatus Aquilonibacter sp.]